MQNVNDRPRWSPLRQLAERLLDRLFAADDARARHRGQTITRERWGTRSYRDPRWDFVSACGECAGDGAVGAQVCPRCQGRGTVRHGSAPDRAALPPSGARSALPVRQEPVR